MKKLVASALALVFLTASTGCASTVLINSQPPGAKVFVDGAYIGKAPASYTDTAIVGTVHQVKLTMPGYRDQMGLFGRNGQFNAGACIGGVFLLVPFLWILDYPPQVTYQLERGGQAAAPAAHGRAPGEG